MPNPLSPLQTEAVVAALRSTGSRDPDVLRERKRSCSAPRATRWLGLGLLALGAAALADWLPPGPIGGAPAALAGGWLWLRATRARSTIERGFAEVVKTPLL
ncbi:MAG: hypothetical protein R2909_15705 [Gemmatimonadales bacterium]